jgi:hypothetical protein
MSNRKERERRKEQKRNIQGKGINDRERERKIQLRKVTDLSTAPNPVPDFKGMSTTHSAYTPKQLKTTISG